MNRMDEIMLEALPLLLKSYQDRLLGSNHAEQLVLNKNIEHLKYLIETLEDKKNIQGL